MEEKLLNKIEQLKAELSRKEERLKAADNIIRYIRIYKPLTKMNNNLELHKQITFNELIKHGIDNGANIVNGMPWSWKINGKSITHENDGCYIIETAHEGFKKMYRYNTLVAHENGLHILEINNY